MDNVHMCDYGCGGEGKFYFHSKNKWCCSKKVQGCDGIKKKSSISNTGKSHKKAQVFTNLHKILCSYGCGNIALYQFHNGRVCCSKNFVSCPEVIKSRSLALTGHVVNNETKIKISSTRKRNITLNKYKQNKVPSFSGQKHKPETIEKMKSWERKPMSESQKLYLSIINTGKKHSLETIQKIRINNTGKKRSEEARKNYSTAAKRRWSSPNCEERQKLLNGGAVLMLSCVQNPSKPQVELWNRIKTLYKSAILNFPLTSINRSLDVAIPELMICFESNGSYWHQNREKDLIRKKQIEDLGWTMIEYHDVNYVKHVPTIEKIKEDIENVINLKEVNYDTTKTCIEVN